MADGSHHLGHDRLCDGRRYLLRLDGRRPTRGCVHRVGVFPSQLRNNDVLPLPGLGLRRDVVGHQGDQRGGEKSKRTTVAPTANSSPIWLNLVEELVPSGYEKPDQLEPSAGYFHAPTYLL